MLSRMLRLWLLLLSLTFALPAAAQGEAARYQRAFERIDAFVAQYMKEARTPGVALALTSRDGLLHVASYGFADLKARTPVTPDTLFEIGSISKSFTAISLLQLREEGRFDPQAPLTTYLPWFEIQTKHAPLTGHHLLTHSAGIPRDRNDVYFSPYAAFALRERETGYAPGNNFAYSNTGFQVLGIILEKVEGQPYAEVVRRRIFERIGMKASEPVITNQAHARLAIGYISLYDDRPWHPSQPLIEAPWFEYRAGDGSVAATAADLAAYLRMLLNRGAAPGGRVLSEESFGLMTQHGVKTDDKAWYGYGIITREEDAHTLITHSGGMIGYTSNMIGDMNDGLGAVAFLNGPGSPARVTEFALKTLRAALKNQDLPELPAPRVVTQVEKAADYAGTYASPEGKTLTLVAEGERLLLVRGEERIALERRGEDSFYVNHPDFQLFLLGFERDKHKKVVEASYGSDWYAGAGYTGPRQFEVPEAWRGYAGHYRCPDPWSSNFRVALRKGKLWFVDPSGSEEELVELAPGLFHVGTEETAERLRFDAVVEGKALRVNASGEYLYRVNEP